jgi:cytochrome c oxidase subunit 3
MSLIQNRSLKQLLWIGMGSIIMFFAGLTSAYVVRKPQGNWTDFLLPDWFLYSTIIVVISSLILIVAKKRIHNQKISSNLILGTFFLGIIFSYCQFRGWQVLTNQGVFLTGPGSNVSGSFLYVITLSHLIHLIGGLIAILITAIKTRKGEYSTNDCLGFDLTSFYWHFVGLLWVYLFVFLKYF